MQAFEIKCLSALRKHPYYHIFSRAMTHY